MTVTRAPLQDLYLEDGEAVVLLADNRVLALSPLSTHVLISLSQSPMGRTELATALFGCFGHPPDGVDPTSIVERLIDDLRDAGLIRDL
jgi:hypothetical protein